ncbi:hypothetical protein [Desulfobacter postgatei]|uniref:hypothetical protein n=1 Tax=Desulfobacter postgatei TaxID=2293 RepID=UPI00259BA880|nr:hypothetical protein [uncultured Desulfobacter sp.]
MIKKGFIEIKDSSVLAGLMNHKFHPALTEILVWLADNYGLVMTESFRPARHRGDVHSTDPVRAIDIRSRCYDGDQAGEIRDEINDRWQYDSNRPQMRCALIHDIGLGVHFHIQVHPNTAKKDF